MFIRLTERLRNLISSIGLYYSDIDKNPSFLKGIGIVEQTIYTSHGGRVAFNGSFWPAKSNRDVVIEQGAEVYIVDRVNITLIVEPA